MILRRLRLTRFGRFTEGEWEFAPGLTVIRGPNEAGKSTMREAIVRLLLPGKKVDTTDSGFLALQSWGSDRRFVLECEFEAAGGRYALTRDFEAGRVELSCADSGQIVTDEPAVAERLWELVGASSREVYETTACLAQQEFVRLEAGEKVAELLQQTVVGSGAQTGAQAVLGQLDGEIGGLTRGLGRPAKNPGPIRATMDRIEGLREEIGELRPIVERAGEATDRIERARERIAQIEQELGQAVRVRERAEERRKLEEQSAAVTGEFRALDGRARKARELSERAAAIEERLAGLPQVSREQVEEMAKLIDETQRAQERAPEAEEAAKAAAEEAEAALARVREVEDRAPDEKTVEEIRSLERDVKEIAEDARQADDLAADAESDLASARAAASAQSRWLVAAGALIVVGAGLALGLGEVWPWLIAAAGLGVGVMGSLRGPRMAVDEAERRHGEASRRAEDLRAKLSAAREELARLLESANVPDAEALACRAQQSRAIIEEARGRHSAASAVASTAIEAAERARQEAEITGARLHHRLEQFGAESPEAFLQTAGEVLGLRDEREKHLRELRGVLGKETLEEIEGRMSELSAERMGLQQRIESEEMRWAALDAEKFEELQSRIEALEDERESLRAEIDGARGAADHPDADPEQVRRLEEQRAAAEEALERLQERRDALALARELLAQAHEETLAQAIDVLEPRTSELLRRITGGRYCEVGFDRATLEPSVHSAEKGCAVDPDDELSCATREQVYVAARLALTRLLWPEECPPIMLDDPFVNFDPARREEALRIVRSVAESNQVLLFTCQELYDHAADLVIELPEP